MRLGQDVLSDLRVALASEWLLANGLGGSASGTSVGAHTRNTHAHLIAAGPHGRPTVLLLKLEERLHTADGAFALGTDVPSQGPARPAGYHLLSEFRLDPWPVWRFRAGGVVIEKSLFMVYGHDAVVANYRQISGEPSRLTVSPLVAARDPFATQREDPEMRGAVQGIPGRVRIETLPGRPTLTLWHNGIFLPARAWQRVHCRALDGVGDIDAVDEAFVPGYVQADLAEGGSLQIIASAEGDLMKALAAEDRLGAPAPRTLAGCVAVLETDERERVRSWRGAALAAADLTARQAAAAHSGAAAAELRTDALIDSRDLWVGTLAEAMRLGITRRGRRLTLLASLPGGEERGTDTLRALAGMTALRGFDAAREILRGMIEYIDEGLAPESIDPVDGTPHHGDPSVSLWLVIAAERHARRSHDHEFAKSVLYPALEGVMHFYRSGTLHGIHVDKDSLLAAGPKGMKRSDLNALWHHAMVAMSGLARAIGKRENGAFYMAWANEHLKRFNELLWDERRGCLFVALGPGGPVTGLAPSQLLAASLPSPLLSGDRAQRLIATIDRNLFTPLGLRAAPRSKRVSPDWLGHYWSARLRANGRSAEDQQRMRACLDTLRARMERGAPYLVPEAYQLGPAGTAIENASALGDPLSIVAAAELLRLWVEELDHTPSPVAL